MQEIYVETWGNDSTGDGSKSNPYASLNKAFTAGSKDCTIYIGEGEFNVDNVRTYSAHINRTVIGNGIKSVLTTSSDNSVDMLYGSVDKPIKLIFKKLIFKCTYTTSSILTLMCRYLEFYNCVLENIIIANMNTTINHFENCTFVSVSYNSVILINTQNATITQTGCVQDENTSATSFNGDDDQLPVSKCRESYRLIDLSNSKYGVYSGEYTWTWDGYLLFMNNKYYSILPNHYVDGAYREVDLATVKADEDASDNYLFFPSDLFEDLTIGEGESAITFKPIEKFDNFQLVDITSEELPESLTVSGLKVNNAMISMIVPVSMKKYNVVHSVTATYEGTVRLAFSFDKGTTWKTFNTTDGVWEDLFIDIALKDYASYTVNDKTNWNKAKAKILTDGIDPADLEVTDLINFNINAKTMLVAAAMERNDYDTPASFSGLTILYDSPNTYERVESTQCKVAITGDTIEVTPTFANNELLITAVTNL